MNKVHTTSWQPYLKWLDVFL